jgi:hypothetical protein
MYWFIQSLNYTPYPLVFIGNYVGFGISGPSPFCFLGTICPAGVFFYRWLVFCRGFWPFTEKFFNRKMKIQGFLGQYLVSC